MASMGLKDRGIFTSPVLAPYTYTNIGIRLSTSLLVRFTLLDLQYIEQSTQTVSLANVQDLLSSSRRLP